MGAWGVARQASWDFLGSPLRMALVAAGAAVAAANLFLPIISFRLPDGSTHTGWRDLAPGSMLYEQALLAFPLAAGATLVACGLATRPLWGGEPRWAWGRMHVAASWGVSLAGFLLALAGTRWIGFVLARREETDLVHLGVVPWLDLGVGALLMTSSWRLGRRGLPAGVAAGGLVLAPLLPFGTWQPGGGATIILDEFALATMARGGLDAPGALAWARGALWIALAVAVAGARWPRLLTSLLPLAAGGCLLLGRFYQQLPHLRPNVAGAFHPVLPLAFLALAVVGWFHLRSSTEGRLERG